jgi:hypothetical protein
MGILGEGIGNAGAASRRARRVLREEAVVEDQAMDGRGNVKRAESIIHSLPQDANCSDQG